MKTKIGGQAVLEGVMMRGETSMALAVRDENGTIRIDSTRLAVKKPWYKKVPFLRGVINLVVSMISGTKIISKSAEVMVEDEVQTDNKGMGGIMAISLVLGLALAVALFIILPTAATNGIMNLFGIQDVKWARSIIEGVFKLGIIIAYMASVTLMKEIRRVYQYHGAEHKTIACYESELPLTVENVQKCSRYHDRCGTSFIVFVMVLSVLLMIAVESICYAVGFEAISITWVRTLIKLAMLPLTAGLSYELLMILARSNFVLLRPLKWFGKQFQKITTKEPDDSMCEVAIAAFNKVLEMDADLTIQEEHFPKPMSLDQFREVVRPLATLVYGEYYNVDYMVADVLRLEEHQLKSNLSIPFGWQVRVEKYMQQFKEGKPIQYVVGSSMFFKRRFLLDSKVLIPRQDTELVVEQAIIYANNGTKVLDMCCGSGVMGITLAKEKGANCTLVDISKDALKLAKLNARRLKAKVKTVQSDMFGNVKGKYELIVTNPPYIPTQDIATLDDSVKNYEPHLALDGGEDGLDFYRVIASQSKQYLTKKGVVIAEIGYNQGEAVKEIFVSNNFANVNVINDYSGNNRIIVAQL